MYACTVLYIHTGIRMQYQLVCGWGDITWHGCDQYIDMYGREYFE